MKTVIITGGNSGIGREAAFQIAAKGHRVILACRNEDAAKKTVEAIIENTHNSEVHYMVVDLSLISQVKTFIHDFTERFKSLDVLINNAADFDLSRKEPKITSEGYETQFVTNLVTPVALSLGLMPLLNQTSDGRILNVSSQGLMVYPKLKFDFENTRGEKNYSPSAMYYQTKLGLMMASYYQREQLKGTSVSVYGIRVTNVKIDMKRYSNLSGMLKFMYSIKSKFSISASEMAQVYTELACGPRREGFYFDEKMKEVKANTSVYDPQSQSKLWALLQQIIQ